MTKPVVDQLWRLTTPIYLRCGPARLVIKYLYLLMPPLKWLNETPMYLLLVCNDLFMINLINKHETISTTFLRVKKKMQNYCIFQILWKSRCDILVSFPSHLKKFCSILRFWLKKLNCGFSPQNNFSSQNFSVENNYLLLVPYGGSSLVV